MNIQPHDRIMLVDGQTKYNLEHNPSWEKLFRDFKICEKENLLGSELVRENHHQVAIAESKDNRFYAPSLLYHNLYYPLEQYNEMYQEDLKYLIGAFAVRMGAKSILYSKLEEQYQVDTTKFEAQFKGTLDLRAAVNFLALFCDPKVSGLIESVMGKWTEPTPIDINDSLSQQNTEEKKDLHKSLQEHRNLNYESMSKEELRAWINQEKIDIKALPSHFRIHVERYLETGEGSGKSITEEEISRVVAKNTELNCVFSLALPKLPNFIGGTLTANYNKRSEYRYLSQIKYEIEF